MFIHGQEEIAQLKLTIQSLEQQIQGLSRCLPKVKRSTVQGAKDDPQSREMLNRIIQCERGSKSCCFCCISYDSGAYQQALSDNEVEIGQYYIYEKYGIYVSDVPMESYCFAVGMKGKNGKGIGGMLMKGAKFVASEVISNAMDA